MRIALTGGGTGGHVTPLEPIVESLRVVYGEKKDELPGRVDPGELDVKFFGVASKETRELFDRIDVPVINVLSGKLRRYASVMTLIDLMFMLPAGIAQSLWHMWHFMPDVVISKGGYGSIPIVLAAVFYRIPVLLHESDSVPGLTNRTLAKLATTVALGMPDAREGLEKMVNKVFITGTPVRSEVSANVNQAAARREFGFEADDKVLLVTGGSQGAAQINELVLKTLAQLIADTAIIHVTGPENERAVSAVVRELLQASSRKDKYVAIGYLDDMHVAYAAADAVVTRAGATTLAEIARVRKPCLIIPLDGAAGDHQRVNARIFEKFGAARVLDPVNLMPNLFERNVKDILENESLREEMKDNLKRMDYPEAARDIAEFAISLACGIVPVANEKL